MNERVKTKSDRHNVHSPIYSKKKNFFFGGEGGIKIQVKSKQLRGNIINQPDLPAMEACALVYITICSVPGG